MVGAGIWNSKLLLSILLIAVITIFINSTPNAFAQTTIGFSSGVFSSVAPGGFGPNTYTESGFQFQTPLAASNHFDSIGSGSLSWHEGPVNTVDNIILSGFGGATFNLSSFDVSLNFSPGMTLTGSNGQTFVVPAGATGTFTPNINGVTSVTWDIAGSVFSSGFISIDNVVLNFAIFPSGGGGPAEPPTIGMDMAGTNLIVTCGVSFDGKCFTITALFHEEFKLYEMMSGTHTISITMYCLDGVNTCNYAAIGIMPYSESMDNTTWKIELYKDFGGILTPVTTDPGGFLGDVTVTTQIIDDKFWLVSFTADFKNKDTGPMKFGVQARNDINAVRNWYLNEGVEFKDSDAYPSIVTEFEDSLEIDSLCLNEDSTYRYSCAFAEIRDLATQNAEETLRQIMNNEYTYK